MRPPKVHRAFTLVELIAVMVLMAILAAVAVPSFASASAVPKSAAARLLAADMAYARQRAAATGERLWVRVDTGADTWSLLRDNPTAPGAEDAIAIERIGRSGAWIVTPQDLGLEDVDITRASFGGAATLGFDWLGRPLASDGAPLATDGVVLFASGQRIDIRANGGIVSGP